MNIERRKFFLLGCLVLLGVCFAVFGRSLSFGFVDYDDLTGVKWSLAYVSGGREMKHLGAENVWHPLTWMSHMLDVSLFGVEGPDSWLGGHHLMNVLLHGVSGCLVFFFFGRLMRNPWVGFWAAVFFLIHPLKVESVAWISERKDVLSGVFFWAALCGVVESFEGKKSWQWVGWVCFGLACMSKPSVVILPGLVVLAEGFYRGEKKWGMNFWVEGVKRWWLWFALSALTAMLAIYFQGRGSHADFMEGSMMSRLLSMMPGVVYYAWRMVVPWDLSFHYPMPNFGGLRGQFVVAGCLLVVAGLGSLLWNKRREWPVAFFAGVWFLLCWLPMSGLAYVGTSFTADRYMYLALSGPLLLLAVYLMRQNWGKWVAGAVALVWGGLSFAQTGVWRDSMSLFSHAVKAQPKDSLSCANLGSLFQVRGNYEKGVEYHEQAVALGSGEYISLYNLGYCWSKLGDQERAAAQYEKSLEVYPHYEPALRNLGLILEKGGDKLAARDLYKRAAEAGRYRSEAVLSKLVLAEGALGNVDGVRDVLKAIEASGSRYSPEFEAGLSRMRRQLGESN